VSKQDETQFIKKTDAFLNSPPTPPPPPQLNANVPFFCRLFSNLTLFWTKLRVLVLCFLDFTDFFNTYNGNGN
jgi:hypothetical protein